MKSELKIYKDKRKHFRWRIKRSGRVVAESGEGYTRIRSLVRSLARLMYDVATINEPVMRAVNRAVKTARSKKFKP